VNVDEALMVADLDKGGPYAICEAADTLAAEVRRLHTWNGLMSLLDEHYPADVMTGESGDPGPRILALVRALDERDRQIVQQAERMRALGEDWLAAPVNWPARFRRAAEAAEGADFPGTARDLERIAEQLLSLGISWPHVVAAIGRALLGEES
jgi:hypothetical protein